MHSTHAGGAGWTTAAQATLHCLTGCAIGEILGMGSDLRPLLAADVCFGPSADA
jgi:hypothetical protein